MFDHFNQRPVAPTEPPPPPKKVLRFDKSYLKTLPGLLKIFQLICNIAGFICVLISWAVIISTIFNIVYWIGIIITGLLLLMYTCHFVEKYDRWPWLKFEFFYCGVMSILYIIPSIFSMAVVWSVGLAVGIFGLCASAAYGLDCFLKYRGWRRGLPAQ